MTDITPLSQLKKLRLLDLEDNGVEDLTALSSLPELEELFLSGNRIRSTEEFLALQGLKALDLHNNMINTGEQELKPLLLLPRLTFLNLHGNPLEDQMRQILKASNGDNCLFVLRKHLLDDPLGLVRVAGGTFTMGWRNEERDGDGSDWEKPAHEVKLNSFAIGRYPVTFEEYDVFCLATGRDKPGDDPWGRGRRPVIYVDWYDAVEYCNWLSELWGLEQVYKIDKNKKDPNNKNEYDNKKWLVTVNENANGYRLPTEAEWEYAARGGQKSEGFLYAGSNELDEVGWYGSNSGSKRTRWGRSNRTNWPCTI